MCDTRYPWQGHLDELRFYSKTELSPSEILQIYNYTCPTSCGQCHFQTQTDTNTGPCQSCIGSNKILENGYCICPPSYYDTETDQGCKECPNFCSKCLLNPQKTSVICLQCKDDPSIFPEKYKKDVELYKIQLNQRQKHKNCQCPYGKYDSPSLIAEGLVCQNCINTKCKTCSNNRECDTCIGTNQ